MILLPDLLQSIEGSRLTGTIGILIRSVHKGYKTEQEIIDLLRGLGSRSTLFIRPSLLAEIIQVLEKEWKPAIEKQ